MIKYNRLYAKVDLDNLNHNADRISEMISPETKVIAVVKTDSYGHGAVYCSNELEKKDYIWGFATATVEEALILRRNGIKKPILVLGMTFDNQYEEAVANDIRPGVYSFAVAKALSEAAQKLGKIANIHIKLDTGMRRIGYQINEESADEILKISKLEGIKIEGMFTHFSKADETDKTYTKMQMENYNKMVELLSERGVEIPLKHCSNSAGILDIPAANMNLVRAGIILYGLKPSDECSFNESGLKPVLSLYARIIHVKELDADNKISYGGTFVTDKKMKIATVAIGYGDGYPRSLSNKGYVLVNGRRANICGRICMDQMMIDVTDIDDVKVGDFVTLIGTQQNEEIKMDDLGDLSGRFNYEFACDLGKRIPRAFIKDGKVAGYKDYFDE